MSSARSLWKRSSKATALLAALLLGAAASGVRGSDGLDQDAFEKRPEIKAPEAEQVRASLDAWLEDRQADDQAKAAVEALWRPGNAVTAADRLERAAASFAAADPRAHKLLELCNTARRRGPLAPQAWLQSNETPAFERNNLRLYYGRWLAHQGLFDEALEQLGELKVEDVVDPASLLFYQGVAYQRLLKKEEALAALRRLLDGVADRPARYSSVAELMLSDLEQLKDESLDHISRQMSDIRRRLGLGRAGKKVRKVEDDVIAALDKLIDEMEKQQQQSSSSSSAGSSGSMQPTKAMQDSRIAGAKGKGDVNRRNIGKTAGWGDLPDKQREEALQQIGKDFPSHYRDAIEQYFRKLASEND
jgi:hypothetical protein